MKKTSKAAIVWIWLTLSAMAGGAEYLTFRNANFPQRQRFDVPIGGAFQVVGGGTRLNALIYHEGTDVVIAEMIFGQVERGDLVVGYRTYLLDYDNTDPDFVTIKILTAQELAGEVSEPDYDVVVETSTDGVDWNVLGSWPVRMNGKSRELLRSRLVKRAP